MCIFFFDVLWWRGGRKIHPRPRRTEIQWLCSVKLQRNLLSVWALQIRSKGCTFSQLLGQSVSHSSLFPSALVVWWQAEEEQHVRLGNGESGSNDGVGGGHVQKLKLDYWLFTTSRSAGAGSPAATREGARRGRPAAARRHAMRDAAGGSALQASSGSARGTGGAGGLRQRGTMRDACGVTVWQSPAGRRSRERRNRSRPWIHLPRWIFDWTLDSIGKVTTWLSEAKSLNLRPRNTTFPTHLGVNSFKFVLIICTKN